MEKEISEFISSTFERKHFEEKFTYTSLYLIVTNVLRMFLTFRRVIPSLSSAFREFIGGVFPLHTHTHARTQTHALIFICYGSELCLPVNIYYFFFFLVAFIRHMQCKKSSLLVDICNFSKTKGLSGNQALNKNSSNGKKQKTQSFQFRTEKKFFLETFGHRMT